MCEDHYQQLITLAKMDILYVSKVHLMSLIALGIDSLNNCDDEIKVNDDLKYLDELKKIFDTDLLDYKYYPQYRDNELDKTHMYLWIGYLRDNDMCENDLRVKLLVLENFLFCYGNYIEVIAKNEVENIYIDIKTKL